jgi:hypothetical protein
MKGSLWSKNAAAAQFRGLWHFSNNKVNTFIYSPKTALFDGARLWQIGNFGKFSRNNMGTHLS